MSSIEETRPAAGVPAAPRASLWRRWAPPALAALLLGLVWVAGDVGVPEGLAPWTGRLQGFVTVFLGIFIEALPFLMAGVLVSSAIHLFVSPATVQRLSPRNPVAAAVAGACLGLAFPVCECGSIPAARRLMAKGAALPGGIAFALAAPVVNPVVLISTFVAFGSWQVVAWRAGLTVLIAALVALVVGLAPRRDLVLAPGVDALDDHDHAHCDHDHGHDHGAAAGQGTWGAARAVLGHANAELFEMMRYLVAGALLAATLQTVVPQQPLLALGGGPLVSVLVLMALAALLSICSTVDSFIALSFVGTFTPGAVLAFLVFGPMIDIKSTLMLTSTFTRRTVATIVLLCAQLALLAGVVVNLFFT
ncbi:MAG TPA: permease [Chloroflexaceae bacterium]|nr:permease [Chloroflexaceae bacterium]